MKILLDLQYVLPRPLIYSTDFRSKHPHPEP